MAYWTLQYFADPIGSPTVFVEKTWEQWQIAKGRLKRQSFDTDELTFVADGQPVDSPDIFSYKSKVIIMRDRNMADDGSFSGGTIYFQGAVSSSHRIGNPMSENVFYTVSGPWWYLKQDCYEQIIAWLSPQPTTHVVLNLNASTGVLWTMSYQLRDILNNALARFGTIFSFDTATFPEFDLIVPPSDEKRDITFAEAIKAEFKWAPRSVQWFDYTQAVPVLHFNDNLSLSTSTVTFGDGLTFVSEDISPRYDLQVAQVIIRYEQNNVIDTTNYLTIYQDTYPASPANSGAIMRATVNIMGLKGTDQYATISTRDLSQNATTTSWWTDKHPELSGYTNLVLHFDGITLTNTYQGTSYTNLASAGWTPDGVYQYELYEGPFHKWMNVGNVTGGQPGEQGDVSVKILADYTDEYGNIFVNQEFQVKVKTTNLTSNTYSRLKITSYQEPVPTGMAQSFYNILSRLVWEGEIVIEGGGGDGSEVSSRQFLGTNLNIENGLTAWATMLATIHSVSEDLESGQVSVRFGQNKFVSPSEIIDLLRVMRERQHTYYTNTIYSGNIQNDDVQSPDNMVKENSTKGSGLLKKHIIASTDVFGNKTTMTHDAVNGVQTASTQDPANGQWSLSLTDLVTNDNMTPP